MKTSTKYNQQASVIKHSEEGFLNFVQWDKLVTDAKAESKSITVLCPESIDSSLKLTFDDKSVLYISNPAQHSYCGFVMEKSNQ